MREKKIPTGDYEVGYCRPPKSGQIKPGEVRNPRGRGKGTKNLKTDLLEELSEKIVIREGDRSHRISKQRALVKAQLARALKGSDRAAAKIFDLYLRIEGLDTDAEEAGTPITEEEKAVLTALEARVLQRLY